MHSVLVLDDRPAWRGRDIRALLGRSTTSTRIIISHRLSDETLLVLIKQAGSHNELIAHGGEYAEMFETQAARFLSAQLASGRHSRWGKSASNLRPYGRERMFVLALLLTARAASLGALAVSLRMLIGA